MNKFKFFTLFSLSFILLWAPVLKGGPNKPFILKHDKKKKVVEGLTADDKGNLKYKTGNVTAGMKPRQYIYAMVPLPKEIIDGKRKFNLKRYKETIEIFDKTYKKYKFLGWGSISIYHSAKSLDSLGKKNEAIAKCELLNEVPKNPAEMAFFLKTKELQADILIRLKEYDKAKKVLNYLSKGNNDESAMFANNAKGDILRSQGKDAQAVYVYLRNKILFKDDGSEEYKKSMKNISEILKAQKHPRAEEFEQK